jgi:hypothetical protein
MGVSPSFSLSGWTAERNHPGKEKASRKILEASTAIWCKHLVSRRPPAVKRRKIAKAEGARNKGLPRLQDNLQGPPDGKDIYHRGAHRSTIPGWTRSVKIAPALNNVADNNPKTTVYCSFCGKSQHDVRKLASWNPYLIAFAANR